MATTTVDNRRSPGMAKAGKVLMILGVVILLLSLIVGGILAYRGGSGVVETMDDLQTINNGQATISAEEGDVLLLLKRESAATAPSCQVTGPDGQDVPLETPTTSTTINEWKSFAAFTPSTSGDHSITCDAEAAVSPPLSVSGIFGAVGGVLLLIGGSLLGLFLLGLGLLLWLLGRRRKQTDYVQPVQTVQHPGQATQPGQRDQFPNGGPGQSH